MLHRAGVTTPGAHPEADELEGEAASRLEQISIIGDPNVFFPEDEDEDD